MIVQRRRRGLRLFRQHDHALAAGDLALAWRDAGRDPPVSGVVVTATAFHDASWQRLDRAPVYDPLSRGPHDFLSHPLDAKFEAARAGISQLERVHPYAALLTSLHYSGFGGAPDGFRRREALRRTSLAAELGGSLPDDASVAMDLELLRLFDVLSLHACLTPPGVRGGTAPDWLGGSYPLPGGGRVVVAWRDRDVMELDPWPFGPATLELSLPCRDLPRARYASAADLVQAWEASPERTWTLLAREPGS